MRRPIKLQFVQQGRGRKCQQFQVAKEKWAKFEASQDTKASQASSSAQRDEGLASPQMDVQSSHRQSLMQDEKARSCAM